MRLEPAIHGSKMEPLQVRAAISNGVLELLAARLEMLHTNINSLRKDTQVEGSLVVSGDPVFDTLMLSMLPRIEALVKCSLYPTYSFGRLYQRQSVLNKHTDRAACEFSVSIPIWSEHGKIDPLYFEGHGSKYLNFGDFVVYRGCEIAHWREPATGEFFAVFLHYVDATGPSASWKYDKRQYIGMST